MRCLIAVGLALFAAGAAGAQEVAPPPLTSTGTVRMSPSEITAYNANFTATDPEFIRCVRSEGPGSMVKRRVCRTNADWSQRADSASQEARDIVDNIQLHGSTHGQEPPGSVFPTAPN